MSWDRNLDALDRLMAGHFDTQAFAIYPMAKPVRDVNAASQPDASREAFEFRGTLEADTELNDLGPNRNASSRTDGARHVARLCLTALATDWPWLPRQGDQIEDCSQRYVVAASPDRDGTDRIVIWLNKARV